MRALWADVDIVPERSERDAVRVGWGVQGRIVILGGCIL